jgi:hypothetical protein
MSDQPRYKVEVQASVNGRVRLADVVVRASEGGNLVATDRGDLHSQVELRRVAQRLADRLHEEADALLALLEAAWLAALEHVKQQQASARSEPEPSTTEVLLELAGAGDHVVGQDGRVYATVPTDDEGHRRDTVLLAGGGWRDWLRRRYWQANGASVSDDTLRAVASILTAQAQSAGIRDNVHLRVAPAQDGGIWLDLADAERRAVLVNAEGWQVLPSAPIRFRRPRSLRPLPAPERGGGIEELKALLNVRREEWVLVVAWLAQALCAQGPYPLLCLHGEHGAAKSTAARVLKGLIDPSLAMLRSLPGNERDLCIGATNTWVLALDNLSHLQPWLSDAFCRLSTGGGLSTRQLYSDEDEAIFDVQRPVVLTGIEDLAGRPDLLDRAIVLTLEPIDEEHRQTERRHQAAVEASRPRILGALLDGIAGGLQRLPDVDAELGALPRMADFAVWAEAVGRALGFAPGRTLAAYQDNRDQAGTRALDGSILADALRAWLQGRQVWEGSCSQLLKELTQKAGDTAKTPGWPRSPASLSGMLRRLAPELRRRGIEVELDHFSGARGHRRRAVRVRRCDARDARDDVAGGGNGPDHRGPDHRREEGGGEDDC